MVTEYKLAARFLRDLQGMGDAPSLTDIRSIVADRALMADLLKREEERAAPNLPTCQFRFRPKTVVEVNLGAGDWRRATVQEVRIRPLAPGFSVHYEIRGGAPHEHGCTMIVVEDDLRLDDAYYAALDAEQEKAAIGGAG